MPPSTPPILSSFFSSPPPPLLLPRPITRRHDTNDASTPAAVPTDHENVVETAKDGHWSFHARPWSDERAVREAGQGEQEIAALEDRLEAEAENGVACFEDNISTVCRVSL